MYTYKCYGKTNGGVIRRPPDPTFGIVLFMNPGEYRAVSADGRGSLLKPNRRKLFEELAGRNTTVEDGRQLVEHIRPAGRMGISPRHGPFGRLRPATGISALHTACIEIIRPISVDKYRSRSL